MKQRPLLLATALWLVGLSVGSGVLLVYDFTPGTRANSSREWPSRSQIARSADKPTLVLFAHPKCPCTRASIGELELLMAHCQGKVDAHVAFLQPPGAGKDWLDSDLWESARAIPGVSVAADPDGVEARNFGATTSGQVFVYSRSGGLLFSGGITASRGHYGDNAGLLAVMRILHGESPAMRETPVFGCALQDSRSTSTGGVAWAR